LIDPAMAAWKACGPVAVPLLLLSLGLFTIGFERALYWWQWWRSPQRGVRMWREQLATCADATEQRRLLVRLQSGMAFGESLLQAVVLLAPMAGLVGTVMGLMRVLRSLGPQLLLPSSNPLVGYADVLISTLIGLQLAFAALALLLLNRGLRRWQRRALEVCLIGSPLHGAAWREPPVSAQSVTAEPIDSQPVDSQPMNAPMANRGRIGP
jgi:biopolymer transport protein ExbB